MNVHNPMERIRLFVDVMLDAADLGALEELQALICEQPVVRLVIPDNPEFTGRFVGARQVEIDA
jgi:hypothetical protein